MSEKNIMDPVERAFEEDPRSFDEHVITRIADMGELRNSQLDEPFESQDSMKLNFKCNACGMGFSKNYNLRRHLITLFVTRGFQDCTIYRDI
ncbi:hypothetical protein AVEN_238624-1 [Araneus ventricosus]|uniref:C2H2-type domain-containing protein n=1 Tax=Araneus ventricosus TaxID=182803 RepID=A0A4Y2WB63_ARAVE|nr:hypothetical protein AVEN_238624-1 [Araneus ventricosus]